MRITTVIFLLIAGAVFVGCRLRSEQPALLSPANLSIGLDPGDSNYSNRSGLGGQLRSIPASTPQENQRTVESLASATSAQFSAQAIERKIIRNAEMTIETDAPDVQLQKITAIAEKHGGFVVTSESKRNEGGPQSLPKTTVTVVARIPAAKFGEAINDIHGLGGQILHKKIAGQDVTEEYIDLEARIRTKRALEGQMFEIMKQARKVSEALEVQSQLADVRTEIERLEGRRRFLENQSALSTITITLHTPVPFVTATTGGFFHDIKAALGDGVTTATEIALGVIRFVIVMIPVFFLILLPGWFGLKFLRRRIVWPRRAPQAINLENQPE